MEENMNPQVQPVTKTEVFPKVFSTPQKEIITEPTPKIDPFENEMSNLYTIEHTQDGMTLRVVEKHGMKQFKDV